jgi:hypothetical protein
MFASLKIIDRMKSIIFFVFCILISAHPLYAQERVIGEGEYFDSILNEGKQAFKISPIRPGQTLQVIFIPQWNQEKVGKVELQLTNQDRVGLKNETIVNPQAEPVSLEWTSNSKPNPEAYFLYISGMNGSMDGESLGLYTLRIHLWDQNDGNSGTDAPETYEKALDLSATEPGTFLFDECFISGTADIYDIYKILLKPNHSLTLKTKPLLWKGADPKGLVQWEFLNKSFKKLREGRSQPSDSSSFMVKVFQPQIKADTKPTLFYLLVKVQGDISLIYSIQADIKEGR